MKKYKILGLFLLGLLLFVSTGSCADKNEPFDSENDFKTFKLGDSRDVIIEKAKQLSDAGEIVDFSPGKDGTSYNFETEIYKQKCYGSSYFYEEKLYKLIIFQKSDSSLSGFTKKIKKIYSKLYGEPDTTVSNFMGGEAVTWEVNGKTVRVMYAHTEKIGEVFLMSIFDATIDKLAENQKKQKKEEADKK